MAVTGGMVSAQAGIASGQRVRKTQPDGGAMGLGMSPFSGTCVRTRVGSGTGAVASFKLKAKTDKVTNATAAAGAIPAARTGDDSGDGFVLRAQYVF